MADTNTMPKEKVHRAKAVKYAIMMGYQGKNYFGMQVQKSEPTIESHLLAALREIGMITEAEEKNPNSFLFQRAARTDKHVSAVNQICSLNLPKDDTFPCNGAERLNAHLPNDIRVLGIRRTPPSFHAQKRCDSRTYSYTLPTFAFAENDQLTNASYRISEQRITEVNELLNTFVGTHNFFNYTARRDFTDQSCFRYMMSYECRKPFIYRDSIRDIDVEFCTLYIRGQSFMLHQIRKMTGMIIAVMRGLVYKTDIQKSFESRRMDVPKAPGLGLLLERLHYHSYDRHFGQSHGMLSEWGEEIERKIATVREDLILSEILRTECQTNSMMMWLADLGLHNFACDPEDEAGESTSQLTFANEQVALAAEQKDEELAEISKKRRRLNE